jgi:hypothetical protein
VGTMGVLEGLGVPLSAISPGKQAQPDLRHRQNESLTRGEEEAQVTVTLLCV